MQSAVRNGALLVGRAVFSWRSVLHYVSRMNTTQSRELFSAIVEAPFGAIGIRTEAHTVLEQVPPLPRPRWWLMRSRLEPRTPFADIAFTWLREAASRG